MTEEHEAIVQEYIQYVEIQLNNLRRHSESLNKPDIQLSDLKQATANRFQILTILNAEYQRYKRLFKAVQEDYRIWWSTEYSLVRSTLNPHSLPGNKFASKAELEAETIRKHAQKYKEMRKDLIDIETKMEFLRRLMDDWRSISFDIANDLKIIELEQREAGLPNMLNRQVENSQIVPTNRQRPTS